VVPTRSSLPGAPCSLSNAAIAFAAGVPVAMARPARNQRVRYLEVAGQGQVDLVEHARGLDLGALAMALVLDPFQAEEGAVPADRQHVEPGRARRLDGGLRPRIVGEDHGRRALGQKRIEQPQLGAMIVLHGRMVVQRARDG